VLSVVEGEGTDAFVSANCLTSVIQDCVAAKCRMVVDSELERIRNEGILVKCYVHVPTCGGTDDRHDPQSAITGLNLTHVYSE
jgi:hypothetical protein